MAEYKLSLDGRTATGKKLNSVRAAGLIPGVIYGGSIAEPLLVQSEYVMTEKTLLGAGYHSPIDVTVAGNKLMVLVKNVDIDPVKRTVRNVEYQAVRADEVVEATAPIVLIGFENSPAHVQKLSLMQVLEEVDVKAKPADLPKELTVDASGLVDADSKLMLADVKLPSGVEFVDKEIDPAEMTVAIVTDPAAEAAAREAEEAAAKPVEAAEVPSDNGSAPAAAAEEQPKAE